MLYKIAQCPLWLNFLLIDFVRDINMQDLNNICMYFRNEYDHDLKIKKPPFKIDGKSSSGYYLCIQTLTFSGPDHGPVDPERCDRHRSCYKSS